MKKKYPKKKKFTPKIVNNFDVVLDKDRFKIEPDTIFYIDKPSGTFHDKQLVWNPIVIRATDYFNEENNYYNSSHGLYQWIKEYNKVPNGIDDKDYSKCNIIKIYERDEDENRRSCWTLINCKIIEFKFGVQEVNNNTTNYIEFKIQPEDCVYNEDANDNIIYSKSKPIDVSEAKDITGALKSELERYV